MLPENHNALITANKLRAAEIAAMEEIGLPEFRELTGIAAGSFGIYEVGRDGVSIRHRDDDPDLTAEGQHQVYLAKKKLSVVFPCSPGEFMKWYDATRGETHPMAPTGTQGVSDFPLAAGFPDAVEKRSGKVRRLSRFTVQSREIIDAFRVKQNTTENSEWWDARLRNPNKYGCEEARATVGAARRQSTWYPDVLAGWLVEKNLMTQANAEKTMAQHFPLCEIDLS